MGLFSGNGGLTNAFQSIQATVANLANQAVSMLSLTLTQTAGNVALLLTTGARAKFGGGTTDFLTSDGATTITAAGSFGVTSQLNLLGGQARITDSNTNSGLFSGTVAGFTVNSAVLRGDVANTGTNAAVTLTNVTALTGTTKLLSLVNGSEQLAVEQDGKLIFQSTDSTGTPGNATINKPSGKSAIAAAAQTCVVTNSTVVTGSNVMLSPLSVDTTAPLLKVSAIANGSFTVTSTATNGTATNATANISFCWWVLN